MIRVAIVEDSRSDADRLCALLEQYTKEHGDHFQVTVFEQSKTFLTQYRQPYDLVFMDIELPDLDGMEAARALRQLDALVTLIFVTNMAQYALHGYEVGALDFVLKPVRYSTFSMKLKKAIRTIQKFNDTELNLIMPNGFARVASSQVLYVEVRKHYLTYHTEETSYTVRGTMNEAEQRLTTLHFLRCNNCYLVNLRHVTAVRENEVLLGDLSLQISRPRRGAFLKGLTDYLGGNV